MVACDRLHLSAPRLCRDDGFESLRAALLAQFDRNLENLKGCVHWLTAQGVSIIDADLKRNREHPHLQVACSPFLQVLFKGDCAVFKEVPEGQLKRKIWKAVRFDIVIWWEEVTCD